jgi:hypothetical protein
MDEVRRPVSFQWRTVQSPIEVTVGEAKPHILHRQS